MLQACRRPAAAHPPPAKATAPWATWATWATWGHSLQGPNGQNNACKIHERCRSHGATGLPWPPDPHGHLGPMQGAGLLWVPMMAKCFQPLKALEIQKTIYTLQPQVGTQQSPNRQPCAIFLGRIELVVHYAGPLRRAQGADQGGMGPGRPARAPSPLVSTLSSLE